MYLRVGAKIAVTGANGAVGRALLESLEATRMRTVALTRTAHRLPATQEVVGPLDSPDALAALQESDYVVHLAGTLRPTGNNSYHAANVQTTETVARALRDSAAKRVLFLSYIGASADAKNAYLRTKAMAERLLAGTGKDLVVFRCTHIIGPPEAPGPTALELIAEGRPPTVLGSGRQVVAPLYVGDVVAALEAAIAGGPPGVYDLAGPEGMSLDDLVRLLNRNPRIRIRHIPAPVARMLGRFLPSLPGPLVEVMVRDSLGDPSRAIAAFGLKLTSLREVWR